MNAVVKAPLHGELIGPEDTVWVSIAPHPLRHERHILPIQAGHTVEEIVACAIAATGTPWKAASFVVYLEGGHPVPRALWHRVRPKPGTSIAMRPVPAGFLVPMFTAISGAIGSLSAGLASMGWLGKLLISGVLMGVRLLLNMLFAPKPPERLEKRPSYSIAGSRNQANQYGAVPVILGRHRVVPPFAAPPYTEIVGMDQYVRMLFCIGYGPLAISQIKIGETPIGNFDSFSQQIREGYDTDAATTLYPRQVQEEPLSIDLLYADSWHRRTTADNINEISIDLTWPQGSMYVTDKGKQYTARVVINWRYRLVGDSEWTNGTSLDVRYKTQDVIRRTLRATVTTGQYEVEVRKGNEEQEPEDGETVIQTVHWTALRGFRTGQPITFPQPLALHALRIRATGQLNGTVDTLNCIAESRVLSWDGEEWVEDTVSRNPADLYRHVLQGPANARPQADDRIDLDALQDWHDYCATEGWTYDKPVTAPTSVYDMLREICAAGRAMPVFRDGKWSVVWDEQDTPVVQMFTPRNSWGFEAQQQYHDLPHAFRVRFTNADKGYAEDERIVYDDGYDATNATKFESIEFPGVTNADLIWRHGRYHIAQLRLRPATYTLNVDFEGLILTRADRVRVQHDVMLVGLGSGRVVEVDSDNQTVTVDEVLTLSSSDSYVFRFRLADGTFLMRSVVASTSGELRTVPLEGTADLPEVGDLFAFGSAGQETAVYRVLGIEPQNELVHRLTLVDDAPEIYDADSGEIPPFESNVSAPVDPFTLAPESLLLTDGAHEENGQFYASLTATWKLPRLGRVDRVELQYRESDAEDWIAVGAFSRDTTQHTIYRVSGGSYVARVRAIFDDGTFSDWRASSVRYTGTVFAIPDDVRRFWISTIGHVSLLSWDAVPGTGVTYEIRHSSESVPNWGSALPLTSAITGTSIQLPSQVGAYLIKAQLPSGLSSRNAAVIKTGIAEIAGMNVIETITESPTFEGTHEDTEVVSGELRLEYIEGEETGYTAEGVYTFDGDIDLGAVYTSRISATISAYGFDPNTVMATWVSLSAVTSLGGADPSGWQVYLEYRSTDDDPMADDWSDWQRFAASDVTARAFQFRIRLLAEPVAGAGLAPVTPSVTSLSVEIDMPDRIVSAEDITVTTSGLRVDFDPPMRTLTGVAIAAQDMATGDYAVISNKDETGFDIIFRDSAADPVERTVDYIARGWGYQHSV